MMRVRSVIGPRITAEIVTKRPVDNLRSAPHDSVGDHGRCPVNVDPHICRTQCPADAARTTGLLPNLRVEASRRMTQAMVIARELAEEGIGVAGSPMSPECEGIAEIRDNSALLERWGHASVGIASPEIVHH